MLSATKKDREKRPFLVKCNIYNFYDGKTKKTAQKRLFFSPLSPMNKSKSY